MEAILARPRGFCAGVVRAIKIVEAAVEIYGAPVFVLHEIVHNQHVVNELKALGALFVERIADIPNDAVVVFSAHGVAAAINEQAHKKNLQVIDATCPLVTKVHLEVTRHSRAGREVILIGHAGHPEVIGTLGRYHSVDGGGIYLVENTEDVGKLAVRNPRELGYVTQTTLSMDDTNRIIEALRGRFPEIIGPRKDDICYATQNRQNAVRNLVGAIDLLLVVGARNSSNSNRLREVGEQSGVSAYLVQDANDLDRSWFRKEVRVGVTAGASTPEVLVQGVLQELPSLSVGSVTEMDGEIERTRFRLPVELSRKIRQRSY